MIHLQHDWYELLRKEGANVWVSCHKDEATIHGIINNIRGELNCTENFEATFRNENCIEVKHSAISVKVKFFKPNKIFSNIHHQNILCCDVTQSGLGISSSSDKSLLLWETNTGDIRRTLSGHVGEQYTCKFFPSGKVILSGGSDMQLRIWCAETGQCPRILTGHSASITDIGFIDRGKNIISASKDGTVKLWDCSEGSCKHTLIQIRSIINSCRLFSPFQNFNNEDSTTGEIMILAACEDGYINGLTLDSKSVFCMKTESAVNVIRTKQFKIFAGCENGKIYMFDVRQPHIWEFCWDCLNSPVRSMLNINERLWIGRQDGSCNSLPLDDEIILSLSGSDCDSINTLCCDKHYIFTGCKDSQIRSYIVN